MQPLRPEIREFIRASEAVMSLESFEGADLSAEDRGVILLYAEDLKKRFSKPSGTGRVDGKSNGQGEHEGTTSADLF